MDKQQLEAFAREAAKSIKTESDLNDFRQMLTKITVKTALMPNSMSTSVTTNMAKTLLITAVTAIPVRRYVPKMASLRLMHHEIVDGSFEPKLVKKQQTRFTSMDDKILSLYAKGMTTREIVATFKEMYGADVSASLISKVTMPYWNRSLNGSHVLWTRFTPLFIWTVSLLRSIKTKRFTLFY